MLDTVVVILIVAAVGVLTLRRFLRTLRGEERNCGCSSAECGQSAPCDQLVQIEQSGEEKRS
jgi:hypothetical protein